MAGRQRTRTAADRRGRTSVESTNGQAGSGSAAPPHVSRDQIARRAYEIYLSRGAADGGDFDDWLQAERELGRRRP
jgi:DUF2934 family protein